MVERTRELQAALGTEEKRVMDNESETVVLQRRAVRAISMLRSGHELAADDLTVLRPCPVEALPPYRMFELVGRKLKRDILEGDIVRLEDVY